VLLWTSDSFQKNTCKHALARLPTPIGDQQRRRFTAQAGTAQS